MANPFKWALAFALTAMGFWLFWKVTPVVFMVLGALLLAATLYPGVRTLERYGLPRIVAIFLLLIGIGALLTVMVLWVLPPFLRQAIEAFSSLPLLYEEATRRLTYLREAYPFLPRVRVMIAWFAGRALALLQQGFLLTWQLALFLGFAASAVVLSIFVLLDGKRVLRQVTDRMPERQAQLTETIARGIRDQVGSYVLGLIILATILGGLVTLAMWLIGMPFPLVLGVLAGFFDLIPYVGPYLSGAIAVSIGLAVDPAKALWTLIAFVFIEQLQAQLLAPYIMGRTTRVNAIWILVSLFVGGALFGLPGMFFAVPVAIVIKVVVEILLPVRR